MTRTHRLAAALALALSAVPACALAQDGDQINAAQILNGRQQFTDLNGAPLSGGSVFIYLPGTSVLASTYQDPAFGTANTNPILLDARGQASIWAVAGRYREVVYDSQGDKVWDQTTSAMGQVGVASVLTPGATIGAAGGDVGCPALLFNGGGAVTLDCTIGPNAVTNGKAAQMAAGTIKGNATGATASPADLVPSQVVGMVAATGAQVVAGTSASVLTTPASLAAAQSLGVDGCMTLPGGLVIQWGYSGGPFAVGATGFVNFITSTCPFTTAVYSVQFTADVTGFTPSVSPYAVVATSVLSTTGVNFDVQGFQSGSGGRLAGFWWTAIGK